MKPIRNLMYVLLCAATSMVGYEIHGNLFYSILNFFFMPISWIVWLIGHDVNMTVIHNTFGFLTK